MRIKKIIELILIKWLAIFSPKRARLFAFRKALNLSFSSFQTKQQGEVEILLLPYLLRQDSTFIDIGANKGLYCFYAEKIIPESNIVAVEPVPKLAKVLKKLFPKATVISKAFSDSKGTAILNIPIHANNYLIDTRSTLEKDSPELAGAFETISVEITTLDECVESLKLATIGLIKMDVEGHEIKLLSGAKKTLLEKRPFMIIEIEPSNHENGLDNAFASIDQYNYSICYFDLNTLSLKLAYDAKEKRSIKLETTHAVHNYVCFPNEKAAQIQKINSLIKK